MQNYSISEYNSKEIVKCAENSEHILFAFKWDHSQCTETHKRDISLTNYLMYLFINVVKYYCTMLNIYL